MLRGPTGPATGAVSQLDYFDALEQRHEVTWDELLAGVLLAAGKRADGSYPDRLSTARRAGILGAQTPPSPDALASSGDLARVLLRAQGSRVRDNLSDEEALALASRRSLVPATLAPNDQLTGAIAVNALAAVGKPAGTRPAPSSQPQTKQPTPQAGGSKP